MITTVFCLELQVKKVLKAEKSAFLNELQRHRASDVYKGTHTRLIWIASCNRTWLCSHTKNGDGMFYKKPQFHSTIAVQEKASSFPQVSSQWSPPSHIQPAKVYATTPISSTKRDVLPAVANTLLPFGLSHFGTNCRQSTRPLWTLLDAHWQSLYPEAPI